MSYIGSEKKRQEKLSIFLREIVTELFDFSIKEKDFKIGVEQKLFDGLKTPKITIQTHTQCIFCVFLPFCGSDELSIAIHLLSSTAHFDQWHSFWNGYIENKLVFMCVTNILKGLNLFREQWGNTFTFLQPPLSNVLIYTFTWLMTESQENLRVFK